MSNSMKPTSESSKGGKRKGTRSVSTLTPAQLARKRANDREAQRAIRARTKEHIENLEREIDELRSHQNRDQTLQSLLRRNKVLEEELSRLKESTGIRINGTNDQYQHTFHSSSPPRPESFGQSAPGYPMVNNITHYSNIADAAEAWPRSAPTVPCSISSTVSSPSSGGTDDFGGGNYIPTSASSAVFERSSIPPNARSPTFSSISGEGNFDELKPNFGCSQLSIMPINPTFQYQPWNMYSMQHMPGQIALDHGLARF
ncbi:hypothetical protein GGR54DRAFT_637765 [Hypoxylon sp. NC1633]|nr:hypothetical protein GGR54DRAFT_637765 [Hypoxylon sp. NC1633]